jgi:hypothetical protein
MESKGFFDALAKAMGKRGGRRGWLEILWDALVTWLRPKVRGAAGERVLEFRLRAELAGTGAVVKGPFMVVRRDGQGTTEMDGLAIAPTGIFVIEAKTYKGEIVGTAKDEEWTQVLGRTRRKFQNPMRQNYGHWREVSHIVGKRLEKHVVPVVAFSGEARFRGERPSGVMDFGDVAAYIKGWKGGAARMSAEDIAEAKRAVEEAASAVTRADRKKHVERLKERHGRK